MTEQVHAEDIEAKTKRWYQEEFVKVQKFCHSKGIQVKNLKQEYSQTLPPLVAVWYIISSENKEAYWVISGDLPSDIAPVKVAPNGREVLRYFSMNWQLKAANLEDALAEGKIQLADRETQKKFSADLAKKAEVIYALYSDDKLWESSGLKRA